MDAVLLAVTFGVLVALVVLVPHLEQRDGVLPKLLEWGGTVLGALIMALTGRKTNDK